MSTARKEKLKPRRRTASDGGSDSDGGRKAAPHLDNTTLSPLVEGEMDYSDLAAAESKEEKAAGGSGGKSCIPEEQRKKVERHLHQIQHKVPFAKKVMGVINMCPPWVRMTLLSLWLLWKVALLMVFIHVAMMAHSTLIEPGSKDESHATARFAQEIPEVVPKVYGSKRNRILYIVTTLAEFNNGMRKTEKDQDRFGEIVIPILVDGVESMINEPFKYHVDVFLIAGFKVKPEREKYLRQQLPNGVGLEIWDDACPMEYDQKNPDKLILNTRALARQHRYVVKDKLAYYDLFVAFEDDMRVAGDHARHYIRMSDEIERLRAEAPESIPDHVPENFHGALTKGQLERFLPGFIRAEVMVDPNEYGAQIKLDPVNRDYTFEVYEGGHLTKHQMHFDPKICCHMVTKHKKAPSHPQSRDVVIWDTSIKAISVLQMPEPLRRKPAPLMQWVGLLPGPGKRLDPELMVSGYWSGRDGAFGKEEKPPGGQPDMIAEQGGWMATRAQIFRMNNDGLCMGSFVPPFDEPMYRRDGQESVSVEYWSGGYQLFTGVKGGCNMQRVFSLDPRYLSNHFLYHLSNNKQRQLTRDRLVRVDNFIGQLNTVKKAAEKAIDAEKEAQADEQEEQEGQ